MADGSSFPPSLVAALRRARTVFVLTGAGISAESGIATYRDAEEGLWNTFNPEEYASPAAWRRNPVRVWEWYVARRESMRRAQPNAAHLALAEWEGHAEGFTLVTQNIDGLHGRAGSRQLIEIHGNLFRQRPDDPDAWLCPVLTGMDEVAEISPLRSPSPGRRHVPPPPETCPSAMKAGTDVLPPVCERCGARIRPDVVWFGEALDASNLNRAFEAAAECDLGLVVGTSSSVEPAASLAFMALDCGAKVIEVNQEDTPLTKAATFALRGPAGQIVPALLEAAKADNV